MKTKTIEVSRWVNIYPEEQGSYMGTEKSAKNIAGDRCIATIELKGSYEVKIPERSITLTESELREVVGYTTVKTSEKISKLFGGES